MEDDPVFKVYVSNECFKVVLQSKSMTGQHTNDPAATKYAKPFLSVADEIGQADYMQTPSRKTCLVIERGSQCNIYAKEPTQDEFSRSQQILQSFDCYGILGIVNIAGFNFLVTVASRGTAPAATLAEGVNVYEVLGVRMTEFARNLDLEANPRVAAQVEHFQRLFNGENDQATGFYFSYHADLTMSQQELFQLSQTNQPYSASLMRKTGYVWNYDILKDFLLQKVSHRWLLPVIQGYCRSDRSQTYL